MFSTQINRLPYAYTLQGIIMGTQSYLTILLYTVATQLLTCYLTKSKDIPILSHRACKLGYQVPLQYLIIQARLISHRKECTLPLLCGPITAAVSVRITTRKHTQCCPGLTIQGSTVCSLY